MAKTEAVLGILYSIAISPKYSFLPLIAINVYYAYLCFNKSSNFLTINDSRNRINNYFFSDDDYYDFITLIVE